MKNYKIRKAKKDDLFKIQDIIYACSYIGYKQNKDTEDIRNHYILPNLKKYLQNSDFFCFTKNKQILATLRLNKKNEICTIYVDPEHHKKGIGTQIIKYLEKLAKKKNIKKVHLHARTSAIGFYEKLGYKKAKNSKQRDNLMEKILE
ncbi:MAG: GNAT family N-acetyltransferase [Candidatus Pacearchaeota archaeon]|nr:GNAT family N-acetyltransferase [Candidatus Pacearchaeota archaeon]